MTVTLVHGTSFCVCGDDGEFGVRRARGRREPRMVVVRGQRDDREPVGLARDEVQRRPADRPRRA